MRLVRYHCTSILTGANDDGFLESAPGAEVRTVEIGWHLYDHNTFNPYCNHEEVDRLLKQFEDAQMENVHAA